MKSQFIARKIAKWNLKFSEAAISLYFAPKSKYSVHQLRLHGNVVVHQKVPHHEKVVGSNAANYPTANPKRGKQPHAYRNLECQACVTMRFLWRENGK